MNRFSIRTDFNHSGNKKCAGCGKVFKFSDIQWDGKDIEYNSDTLWIDSFCSKKCVLTLKKKADYEAKLANIDNILWKSGVPEIYLRCSFENFRPETPNHLRAIDFLKSITLPLKKSILLLGPCGTGKTHLAVATMRKLLISYPDSNPLFISAPRLIGEIRAGTVGESEFTEEEVIAKYTTKRFLVIDDIGVEKPSAFVAQCWYRIVDTRTANGLPTMFTSNLNREEITEQMGPRVASRLFGCTTIPIDGTDKRGQRL
jgi:DNA replication protein DnaC